MHAYYYVNCLSRVDIPKHKAERIPNQPSGVSVVGNAMTVLQRVSARVARMFFGIWYPLALSIEACAAACVLTRDKKPRRKKLQHPD